MKKIALGVLLSVMISSVALAAIDVLEFDSPQQEAQYRGLIADFRCPTCQNQNLAGSDAPIAQDLKQKTYEMVKDGRTDSEIRAFMFERYGDFISYKPPVRPSTWILWFFPPILLVMLIVGWLYRSRKPKAMGQDEVSVLSDSDEARIAKILAKHGANTNASNVDSQGDKQ
ncbi:MAG: cytochrome c-type biogenesis protein CcmH [Moraxella sp.]|nr:cytochrome c-type biogenesis protein CcmH [Moraxella sp.]